MSDDLDILDPAGAAVTYRGERMEVRPLTVGQLPRMVRVARPLIDAVLALEAIPDEGSGALVDFSLDLVDQHGDAAFEAAAIATGRPREWIEGGDIEEFVGLAKAVIGVNRDFFARRLAPLLARAGAAAATNGAGQTSSSSSSSAGTH